MMSAFWKTGITLVTVATLAACSGTTQTPTSPSAAAGGTATAAADGSTLKASAPGVLEPVGGVRIETRRPTMVWTPSVGTFTALTPSYEVEVRTGGAVVYTALVQGTSHQVPEDAATDTEYTWRVRARQDTAFGPWSANATFVTPEARVIAVSTLGFNVPESCGPVPNPTGNRLQCALDVAGVSPEWGRCQGGSGLGCHRYTRHLAAALATGDARFGLISKNPGEQQCTWNRCGGLSGEGYGEDVVAFNLGGGRWEGWDVVSGAGAPGARAGWVRLESRRAGNNWFPVPNPITQ
jgi:hypothetical protein